MDFNMKDMFRGCLIASIAHAIMTNIYPEFSYEQSWDGANYSIQNSSGLRATITFEANYCVGAIRNENSEFIADGKYIQKYMESFPVNIIHKACEEALQYLLLESNGVITPHFTSIFWADDTAIYYEKEYIDDVKKDFMLFDKILLPKEKAINEWKEYYGMDSNAIKLLNNLYKIKERSFASKIILNEEQKQLIPGAFINAECIESLNELNIFV